MVRLGVSPELAAGADALQRGKFEEGIALTQTGLDQFVSSDDRAGGLSNLCAGYIGLGNDQDDNNPSWRGFGGGQIRRTQIYRYVSN